LTLANSNGASLISWLLPSANFVLQRTPNLAHPNWTDVTNPPSLSLSNLQNQVTVPQSGGSAFYRLSLSNLRINQGIDFFPKQHYSPPEPCNVCKVLRAGLALAQSVWVQPSEQPPGLFKAN